MFSRVQVMELYVSNIFAKFLSFQMFFHGEHATLKYFMLHSFIKSIQIRLNHDWNYGEINFY